MPLTNPVVFQFYNSNPLVSITILLDGERRREVKKTNNWN
jgi:hypothetical protein